MNPNTILAYLAGFVGLLGGGIALFNAWKAVRWKRAELANNYLKDLLSDDTLGFACRAIEWNGGRLVVPDRLQPLLPDEAKSIVHAPEVLRQAMRPDLLLSEMAREPRLQLYRTAMDSLLSWMNLVCSALDRDLFEPEDVDELGYWVLQIELVGFCEGFIDNFGYRKSVDRLRQAFAYKRSEHRDGRYRTEPITVLEVGRNGRGQSLGG